MSKRAKHMDMRITKEEHEKWHSEHGEMTPKEHKALTRKMGISEDEHDEWHKKHEVSQPVSAKKDGRPVNPYAIGGGFLNYCIKQGWMTQEGKGRNAKYYVIQKGEEELARFGIEI